MTAVTNFFGRIWQWIFGRIVPPYRTVDVEEHLPSVLAKRTLYVVSEDGYEELAAMLCPCGCRQVLHMNLLGDERPRWRVRRHLDGTTSLEPSIWRKKDCRSHLWFKRGRVHWC